ncbi:TPA: cation:dicarboxylase symporter family transporter [Candidatus Avigastranaerophilus faecigallinarum]|nr:cation:dicarboxylase symporter family transporter [Candidatus Avigastranaerophilus faecigallinarum]
MKTSKLTIYIFLSLVLGILVGWKFPEIGKQMHPLAHIFLNMIKMIIAPLLFSVVVTGIASHGNMNSLGKLGAKTVIYFAIATSFALIIGLGVGFVFKPGDGFSTTISQNMLDTASVMAAENSHNSFIEMIVNIVPASIIKAMAEGDLLQIVVFSIFFALAICAVGEKAKPVLDCISSLSEIMFKFTHFVMNFAPIGVFGAIAYTIAESGLGVMVNYAKIIGSLYFALIVFLFLILNVACRIVGISVFSVIRAIREPALLAFTTATSEAALPQAMKIMESFGVPKNIVGFVMPTGYTFNLDGSTLYLALAMLFSLQIVGIEISPMQLIFVMGTLMLTSKGIAGVPRVALVILAGTLSSFGYPLIGVAILLGIDQILDMGRTTVNLIGNCVATIVIARWENVFNYTKMEEFNKQFEKPQKKTFPIFGKELISNVTIEEHSECGISDSSEN